MLERDGLSVGVVTGTAGVERHAVRIRGQAVAGRRLPDGRAGGTRSSPAPASSSPSARPRATSAAARPSARSRSARRSPRRCPACCELDRSTSAIRDADALAAMAARCTTPRPQIAVDERVAMDFERDLVDRAGRVRRRARRPRRGDGAREHRRQRAAASAAPCTTPRRSPAPACRPSCCSSRAAAASATRARRTRRRRRSRPASGPSRP